MAVNAIFSFNCGKELNPLRPQTCTSGGHRLLLSEATVSVLLTVVMLLFFRGRPVLLELGISATFAWIVVTYAWIIERVIHMALFTPQSLLLPKELDHLENPNSALQFLVQSPQARSLLWRNEPFVGNGTAAKELQTLHEAAIMEKEYFLNEHMQTVLEDDIYWWECLNYVVDMVENDDLNNTRVYCEDDEPMGTGAIVRCLCIVVWSFGLALNDLSVQKRTDKYDVVLCPTPLTDAAFEIVIQTFCKVLAKGFSQELACLFPSILKAIHEVRDRSSAILVQAESIGSEYSVSWKKLVALCDQGGKEILEKLEGNLLFNHLLDHQCHTWMQGLKPTTGRDRSFLTAGL